MSDAARPFWSVMIPAYNSGKYLDQTLNSVLAQDPGDALMQIAVVDDCSPEDPAEIVRRIGGDRVELFRQPETLGLAGNWNSCIKHARGEWIHILHGDDYVLPGYYSRLYDALKDRADVGAAYCPLVYVDEAGRTLSVQSIEAPEAGILEGWLEKLAIMDLIGCPAVVVRKTAYRELGGFRTDLKYALDWEMWVRIASRYRFWYEPQPLLCYRVHASSETARMTKSGETARDARKAISIMKDYLPAGKADHLTHKALVEQASLAIETARKCTSRRDSRAAVAQLFEALRCCPEPWVLRKAASLLPGVLSAALK